MLQGIPLKMSGRGLGGVGGVAQGQQDIGGQVVGQIEDRVHGGHVKGADPAGAHAQGLGGQHHLGGSDGAVHLGHAVIHLGAVASHLGVAADHENGVRTVALLDGAHLFQRLGGADDEDSLGLEIHGGGGKPSRLQNLVQHLVGDGGIGKGAQGVAVRAELEEVHGISPFGC